MSYYCARRVEEIERLGLLDRLDEDGLFGVHTFTIDGRRVSRDLLDSALELAFLERHLGISRGPVRTILDIGAGYGRLAHRAATAFPETVRYLCTDAIPTSTFLCEYYLGFRGLTGGDRASARVVPLHELESAIRPGEVDIAVNIHSFSECPPAAIEGWLGFLAGNRVAHLMIVPNAMAGDGVTMLTNAGLDFTRIVLAARLPAGRERTEVPGSGRAGVRRQPGRPSALPARRLNPGIRRGSGGWPWHPAGFTPSGSGETTQAAKPPRA